MKPHGNSAMYRQMVMEDTGISTGQVMKICAKIEQSYGPRFQKKTDRMPGNFRQ